MSMLKTIYGNDKPTLPTTVVSAMTDKELSFLIGWMGPKSKSDEEKELHKTLLETVKPYLPLSSASKTLMLQTQTDRKNGIIMQVGNAEQALWKTGGAVYYTKDEMVMVKGTGAVTTVPNTIIPDPIARKRNGLIPITVLMSSIVKIRVGEMELIHDPKTFHQRWTTYNSPFKPIRMLEVLDVFKKAVADSPQWKIVQDDEATLTNDRLVDFLYTVLHDLHEVKYFYLHTFVCFELLNIFNASRGRATIRFTLDRMTKEGAFAVPETAYTVLAKGTVSELVDKEIRAMGYPAVVILRGGIQPNIKISRDEDMASAVAAKSVSISTRGSDKSAMSFLCRNAPYSGLSTEEVRTLQRAVSMVGGAVLGGVNKIDVEISSVSHVPIIYTSLSHHFPKVDWVLYMTSEFSMKTSSSYASRIQTDRRRGAHLIRYVQYQMKSHSMKKKDGADEMVVVSLRQYQEDSVKWAPHAEYSGYSIYTTLFGYYPWAVPKVEETTADASLLSTATVQPERTRSYIERSHPPRPHYVYRFGQTESFCGIVSTVKSLSMWGMECTVTHEKTKQGPRDTVNFTEKHQPLQVVKTENDWYGKVIASNAAMESYWMHARPKYSTISNVLRIPKNGVSVAYNVLGEMEIEDQGVYVEGALQEADVYELNQDLVDMDYGDYDEDVRSQHETVIKSMDPGYEYEDDDTGSSANEEDSETESQGSEDDEVPPPPPPPPVAKKKKAEKPRPHVPVPKRGPPVPKTSSSAPSKKPDDLPMLVVGIDQM